MVCTTCWTCRSDLQTTSMVFDETLNNHLFMYLCASTEKKSRAHEYVMNMNDVVQKLAGRQTRMARHQQGVLLGSDQCEAIQSARKGNEQCN